MSTVLRVADVSIESLRTLLDRFRLNLEIQSNGEDITGSFWGDSEAGVVATTVYVRLDTPVHSLLHESCHIICMTDERRADLHREAGGDDTEETAVCYLQILLAECIESFGRERIMQDMDSWGYSFRLGTTRQWFDNDADDARQWLVRRALLDEFGQLSFRLRSSV